MSSLILAIRLLTLCTVALATSPELSASPSVPLSPTTLKTWITYIDELYRSKSSRAEMEMKVVTPHYERTLRLKALSRGMDDTLVRILEPKKDEGIATLKRGNQMWNFFPKINQVIKVPPSMMMGSWMGSDFTNDDLVREASLAEDYKITLKPESSAPILILTPKKTTATVWARIEITVDTKNKLPRKEIFFDEKGKAVRSLTFEKIKQFGSRKLPSRLVMTPLHKKGHRTEFTYLKITFDVPVKQSDFSLRALRKKG